VHAAYGDFFDLGFDLNRHLKSALDRYGITIPYPKRIIHHHARDDDHADTGTA
jgi:small-conductance mechanosensitive channel